MTETSGTKTDLQIYDYLIKVLLQFSEERIIFSTNEAGSTGSRGENESCPLTHIILKNISSRWSEVSVRKIKQ